MHPKAVDLHTDVLYRLHQTDRSSLEDPVGKVNTRTLRRGRVQAIVLSVWPGSQGSAKDLERMIALGDQILDRGEVRGWLALEGLDALGNDPDAIKAILHMGVNIVAPVHTRSNAYSDSATGRDLHGGLSAQGRQLVEHVLDADALLDIAHASDSAAHQMIAAARHRNRPILVSHTAAQHLCPLPRNLSDELAVAVADTDGVIGVLLDSPLLTCSDGLTRASVADVADHIEHFSHVAGWRHVAIGSDLEGLIHPPLALRDPSGFPVLAKELSHRGWPREQIRAVFSGNALRVLSATRAVDTPGR